MEKKGDPLNQLAIISDLLEKVNINTLNTVVVFDLSQDEFKKIYELVYLKAKSSLKVPKNTFQIKIGGISFVFNMNNV